MKRLLITDLDNTLYDWVTYFARSIRAMVDELAVVLDADKEQLLDEIQANNRQLGTVEQPFSVFELPSVRERFGAATPRELKAALDSALHAFNSERRRSLYLYSGVSKTLEQISDAGVVIVGHTEASLANAYYRLLRLGVVPFVRRLYVLESEPVSHPEPTRQAELQPPPGLVVEVPRAERKPNPALLLDICRREGIDPHDSIYVGDSRTKDILMARQAGVTAAWAKYGTGYSSEDWATVVRITNWSADDVRAEAELRNAAAGTTPDLVLGSFGELLQVFGLDGSEATS
jgi:phosphoglycolate phosphatase-like HAD superfamily hydrolase